MDFDKDDIRKTIYFHWKSGMTTAAIHNKINKVLGSSTVSLSTCQRWVFKFNEGKEDVDDENRSGRPSVDLDDEILLFLENDRFATTGRMAQYMDVSDETIRKKASSDGKKVFSEQMDTS